ncbi:MAG: hypothetical protein LBH58_10880 [Tannerellaceae bacterium]|jgi:hypothetical protein|nr:hypothetical protein [Tannerellaceae bacterium]
MKDFNSYFVELNEDEMLLAQGGGWISYALGYIMGTMAVSYDSDANYYALCMGH